ncbi:MAG: class I SAM-dependent methyltransferase [Planctomycetia bacterium]|nr:MAG: class I SAM-dependent methyltransferase [Planctomycetia bacterium]
MSVTQISPARWSRAQQWELSLWSDPAARQSGDDWNHWWRERFDHYSALPTAVDSLIELGCGPFTNARLILEHCRAARVVCSDPLAERYASMPDCWLAQAAATGRIELDTHPIEELPFADGLFDVVVMINVLDHVRDGELCLRRATGLVRPNGWLVLGQDLSDDEDIRNFPHDLGHPIRLALEDVEPHLMEFEPHLRRVLPREEGRNPEGHYATLLYIGRRRTS